MMNLIEYMKIHVQMLAIVALGNLFLYLKVCRGDVFVVNSYDL